MNGKNAKTNSVAQGRVNPAGPNPRAAKEGENKMATTTEQRHAIEVLKREVWAAKVVAEQKLADKLQAKKVLAEAEAAYVNAQMNLDDVRNRLIAALDELA